MAEEFDDDMMDEAPPSAPPKKGKSKLMVIGIPVIIIQLILAYIIVTQIFMTELSEKNVQEADVQNEEEEIPSETVEFKLCYLVEDLTVLLFDGKRSKYLVTSVGFETGDQKIYDEMALRDSQIRDIISSTAGSKEIEQLYSVHFREDTLKQELKDKVNAALSSVEKNDPNKRVRNIYFSQYVIQ